MPPLIDQADILPAPRRRGRPPANAVAPVGEERLLALAFAQFAERGYDATMVRDLARQLDISHNLLNVRFGKKSDLWKAAVEWRLGEASRDVEPAFDRDATAEERLIDLIERFCQWASVHPDIVGICYHEGQQPGWRLDFIVNRFIRPFQARLDRLIEDVRQTRPVSPIATGALLALLVHGVGSYFTLQPMQAMLTSNAPGDRTEQGRIMARLLIAGVFGGV